MYRDQQNARAISWWRIAGELAAISIVSVAIAFAVHNVVAEHALATTLDGLDNVFLAGLIAGLALLDTLRRFPASSRRSARRVRLLLWLAYSGACLIFGAYALTVVLLVELIFDLTRALNVATKRPGSS